MDLLWNRFLSFEEKNALFDIKDKNEVYVWDIVRFYIYIDLLWGNKSSMVKRVPFYKRFFRLLRVLACYVRSMFVRGDYLFFLASRNRVGNTFIDKNAYNVLQNLPSNKIVAIESYEESLNYIKEQEYKLILPLFPFHFISKFWVNRKFDFTPIISKVKAEFPESRIDIEYLNFLYNLFYVQRSIYKFLLRRWKIRQAFLTQNEIQKALIAACNDLNIPIYEFQHGIVDKGHLAYSYPNINLANVYLPNKIMSFSDFWFKDCFIPKCEVIPMGNDYFLPVQNENTFLKRKGKILVVSADVFGRELAEFVQECAETDFFKSYEFYFKLHPNQFDEYDYYLNLFKGNNHITVLRNEKDIPTLVSETEVMLTIQSTALYEGLQKGIIACILKRSSYMRQAHVFNLPNVFLIDSVSDFEKAVTTSQSRNGGTLKEIPHFFEPFSIDIFRKKILNE